MNGPKLRFSEFSGEWEEKKLGQLTKFSKGKNISKDNITGEGTPCVRYGELYTTYKEKIKDPVSKTNLNSDELVFSEENDVIIPTSGETAIDIATVSCIMKDGVAIGGDTTIMKIKGNGLFYSYYLNSRRKKLARLAQGASVVHLYANHLKNFNLNIPSNPEQEKIASFLSKVDIKIEKLEKKQELWETYKKGIMQQIFSQKLRFKNENGEDYPDWVEKTLNEISSINPKSEKLPEEFVYIDLESVESGVLKKQALISKDKAPSRAQRILQNHDILYQTVRPYQRNNLFFNSTNSRIYVASTGYAQIRSKENSKFIYHVLHTDDFVNKVLARCTGTSYPAINSKDLGKIKLNVPSIPEQEKVSKFISAIESKINQLNTELDINRKFKKGLLQQMFC